MKTILIFILAILLTVTSFAQVVLDSTFGNNGIVRTTTLKSSAIYSIAIQTDGKIVAAGINYSSPTIYHFQIVRYLPNGLIDSIFGINGFVNTEIQNLSQPSDVLIQDDGKIVVAGYTSGVNRNVIVRYLENGILDSTFGGTGIVQTIIGTSTNDGISEIAFQPDGKIIAGGWSNNQFLVMRFLDIGILDTTFGVGGIVTTSVQTYSSIWAISLQNDGKIVVSGTTDTNSGINSKFALARYNTDGSLDNTFGIFGVLFTDVNSFTDEIATSLEIQSDNKIMIAGNSGSKCALARYNNNGVLDSTFGINGLIVDDSIPAIVDLRLQSDGKILAVGNNNSGINLARFEINGNKDNTFGNNGLIIIKLSMISNFGECLMLQTDGKIVLGGSVRDSNSVPRENLLVRFNNDIGVGLEEVPHFNNQFLVYPNPANNWLTVSVKKSILGKIKIEAFDLAGKLVLSEHQLLQNEFLQVNVSSIINNGIYLFKLTFPDGTNDVFKISVNR